MSPSKTTSQTRHSQPSQLWTKLRWATQLLSLAIFIITIFLTRANGLPPETANLMVRISPLAMLAQWISSRTFLTGMLISLMLLILSLIFGRAWCGWLCPLGTILDIFPLSKHAKKIHIPEKTRTVKYGLLIAILTAAIFSNLSLLIFDPMTIFVRSFTLTVLPVTDKVITTIEKILVGIPFLREPTFRFDLWLRPAIFPLEPSVVQYVFLTGGFFAAIILLNLLAERFWCRYICPLGAFLGLISKAAIFKRRLKDSCTSCGLCETDCPTGTINPKRNYASDPSECTMCMRCMYGCQKESVTFTPGFNFAQLQEYDPSRRTFFNTVGISIFAVALLAADWVKKIPRDHLLRPPGTHKDTFNSQCIRCGLCIKACPTHALQPDYSESGLEGVTTPILVPRVGFCQYSCNTCGQVCPVQAIPPLTLDEKKNSVIGKAYIDHDRCIAWGDHQSCIVCEEMCPLPQKAISLQRGSFEHPDGSRVEVLLPVVDRDTCIGCGTCENKCPVMGEAAIKVYTTL